ncbi:hypothetical protein M404DRAFT_711870 [Pisolithus tinctorius Marx 270]|uniref:Uncharacterized protein n=1 Tax=Pisolithus tinctorius Marx 270 TaxID=870435 RepID=A0A0C3P455_PISTI|nr:hypothetical protein M404DRAFT_711870 [Pisolithus tinctorius Marx 270]
MILSMVKSNALGWWWWCSHQWVSVSSKFALLSSCTWVCPKVPSPNVSFIWLTLYAR